MCTLARPQLTKDPLTHTFTFDQVVARSPVILSFNLLHSNETSLAKVLHSTIYLIGQTGFKKLLFKSNILLETSLELTFDKKPSYILNEIISIIFGN